MRSSKTPAALDSKAAYELVTRAVTALAGDKAARSVAPSVQAVLDLAQATAMAGASDNRRKPVITSMKVSVGGSHGGGGGGGGGATTVFNQQPIDSGPKKPIDAGPKPRTPIRVGGGSCFTVGYGVFRITICIEWESP